MAGIRQTSNGVILTSGGVGLTVLEEVLDSESVTLAGGASQTSKLATVFDEEGDYIITVSSDDSKDTIPVTVTRDIDAFLTVIDDFDSQISGDWTFNDSDNQISWQDDPLGAYKAGGYVEFLGSSSAYMKYNGSDTFTNDGTPLTFYLDFAHTGSIGSSLLYSTGSGNSSCYELWFTDTDITLYDRSDYTVIGSQPSWTPPRNEWLEIKLTWNGSDHTLIIEDESENELFNHTWTDSTYSGQDFQFYEGGRDTMNLDYVTLQ